MNKELETDLKEQLDRQRRWAAMTPEQKKKQLFLNQKELLDKFVRRHAISPAQYRESLAIMTNALNQVS